MAGAEMQAGDCIPGYVSSDSRRRVRMRLMTPDPGLGVAHAPRGREGRCLRGRLSRRVGPRQVVDGEIALAISTDQQGGTRLEEEILYGQGRLECPGELYRGRTKKMDSTC